MREIIPFKCFEVVDVLFDFASLCLDYLPSCQSTSLIAHFTFSNRISEVDTIKSKVNGLRRVIDTFNENFIQIYFPFFFPRSFFVRCFMHFNIVSMKVQLFVDITNCYYAHKSCCSDKFSCY